MFNIKDDANCAYWQLKFDQTIFNDVFYRHMHDNVEFHLITKGEGIFNVNGTEINVSELDLIIIPPHYYHVFNVDKNKPYERFVFNFPMDYYSEIDLSKIADKPHIYNLSNHYEILNNFNNLSHYSETLKPEDFKTALHLLVQLILIQIKNTPFSDGTSKSANRITSGALRFIDDHLFEPLDVGVVANALFVSKSHLQNTFYKSMKIGLKTFIIQKKMDQAQQMLNEGKQAQYVAEKLGYRTYSTFYKSYLNIYHHPPKVNRKNKK